MKITDNQIVSYMLDVNMPSNELVTYLQVIEKLLKKYGRVVFSLWFQKEIKVIQPQVVPLLQALILAKKIEASDIKHIIILIKKQAKDYNKRFVVKAETDEHYQQVKSFLDKKFSSSEIEQHKTQGNSIRISGEWWFYKRGLEQDIKKLLGLQ